MSTTERTEPQETVAPAPSATPAQRPPEAESRAPAPPPQLEAPAKPSTSDRGNGETQRLRKTPLPPLGRTQGSRAAGARRFVKRRVTVRKLDPWSVLKLSLIFYFSFLLIVMLAITVFWAVVHELGVIDSALAFLRDMRLEVSYDGGNMARAIFLVGLLNVVLASGINVFLCFLYNLVADLVGGFRLTLAEEE